jgi:hypothetical protein
MQPGGWNCEGTVGGYSGYSSATESEPGVAPGDRVVSRRTPEKRSRPGPFFRFLLGATGLGLTCATFVLADFHRAGLPLVAYSR